MRHLPSTTGVLLVNARRQNPRAGAIGRILRARCNVAILSRARLPAPEFFPNTSATGGTLAALAVREAQERTHANHPPDNTGPIPTSPPPLARNHRAGRLTGALALRLAAFVPDAGRRPPRHRRGPLASAWAAQRLVGMDKVPSPLLEHAVRPLLRLAQIITGAEWAFVTTIEQER